MFLQYSEMLRSEEKCAERAQLAIELRVQASVSAKAVPTFV
jgi:hypothetical protein